MSEEKKPTETQVIRRACESAIVLVEKLIDEQVGPTTIGYDEFPQLKALLLEMREANEARDKSRKLSLDVSLYDFTEPMVRALLSQGFDVALGAVASQLKTVQINGRGMISWVPPENPFGAGTKVTKPAADKYPARATACTCPSDSGTMNAAQAVTSPRCPVHGERGTLRNCDCDASDRARGIHFNECTPEHPWKRRRRACGCPTQYPCDCPPRP